MSIYFRTKNIIVVLSAAVLLLLGVFAGGGFLNGGVSAVSEKQTVVNIGHESGNRDNPAEILSDIAAYRNLPVSKVTFHSAPATFGTAVLIPQYHRNPGSEAGDGINDSAQQNQEQTLQIVKHLAGQFGVKLFVVEGQLAGPVPSSVIEPLKEKIDTRDRFLAAYRKLNQELEQGSINPQLEDDLRTGVDKQLAKTGREIILKGAPLVYKAEGGDITLFGSENQATLQESAALVRDNIYLQDRLDNLETLAASGPYLGRFFDASLLETLTLILSGGSDVSRRFDALESEANQQGKQELAQQIELCRSLFSEMTGTGQGNSALNLAGNASSRADNPYNAVYNTDLLRRLLVDSETKIERTVVEKRNFEAAENFVSALKESGQTVGVIQFGAGHEEGLTKELNKLGLNVIVVTPQEVTDRNVRRN
ncbi:MAG: hypothetical protein HYX20_03420 [Candidatus Yanofskybacteria bacterium]|nr:hypothetical protein [Candidatus Yanofskybacteria bacterium]